MVNESEVQQGLLFDERFVEMLVGHRIVDEPKTALMELIANSWDAGATKVRVLWPVDGPEIFSIQDNGHGMTDEQFRHRWSTLAYNRLEEQGRYAEFPPDVELPDRETFGRNGIGRFAAFCFGDSYEVETWRGGVCIRYRVERTRENPLELTKLNQREKGGHGTIIEVTDPSPRQIPADRMRAEIGMRFLTDPNFRVELNGEAIDFSDIPTDHKDSFSVDVDGLGTARVRVVDTQEADRTTDQHGIAWHVNRRLVGPVSWRSFTDQAFLDGRSREARRFTFFVIANFLREAVRPDWSGFKEDNERFNKTNERVSERIRDYLADVTEDKRQRVYEEVKREQRDALSRVSPRRQKLWGQFVKSVQRECPTIGSDNLKQLAGILANLEASQSQYGLIEQLHELDSGQLDDLHDILEDWTVDMAKEVLDELQGRLRLLDTLMDKVRDEDAHEVQELQPLFHRGLWIFGPEYETIEFTSNKGMTTVIQELFGEEETGSRKRPDFVVLPNGSAGFYSYPKFEDGSEIGVDRVAVVELKRAGVKVGDEEKTQAWKYVKELRDHGLIQQYTDVSCFVLGSEISPLEQGPRTEELGGAGHVKIRPLNYEPGSCTAGVVAATHEVAFPLDLGSDRLGSRTVAFRR